MRTQNIVITAVVGFGLAGATVIQAVSPSLAPGLRGRPSEGAAPRPQPRQIAAEGRIVTYPGGEVRVAAERPGRLVRVLVEEGRTVRKGELLAELDSEELLASLEEARARVAEAEAELRLAELSLGRKQALVAEGVLSAQDLDQARRDLEIMRARLETARAIVVRLEASLRKTRIVAPIAGSVTARHADGGETVSGGDAIVTLADLSRLRIEAEADEADAGDLAPGAPVVITADGYPGLQWKGRIEEVPASVTVRRLKPLDPGRPTDTRVLAVKVAFAEPTPLKLGTTVALRIEPAR